MTFRSSWLGALFSILVMPVAASGCSSCDHSGSDYQDPASSPSSSPQNRGENAMQNSRLDQPKDLPPAHGLGYQVGRRAPDASPP